MLNTRLKLIPALLALAFSGSAFAVTMQDNFTGTSSSSTLDWNAFNGACLTAGDGTGNIPACQGLAYYSQNTSGCTSGISATDASGSGALRLTTACQQQKGAIVSGATFPTNQGLQVTFTTYVYGGTNADGIGFFLMDGSVDANIGGTGGSLGYSCSNNTGNIVNGVIGGYLGLGMDEYGNFLNQGDNTSSGWGFKPQRIGLRGAGNVNWTWLNSNYPSYYPSTLTSSQQTTAVANTCKYGTLWNYSNFSHPSNTNTALMDYPAIPNGYLVLPSSQPISNVSARARSNAWPITYKLLITPAGYLSFMYSYNGGAYQPVLTNQSITASNGPLPSTFRFGFTGSTGGSTNVHEITCFQAQPIQSASSVGANTIQSGQVKIGTQIYLAYYNANNWWGSLVADPLVVNGSGVLSASTAANWDANCVLTGGACTATNNTSTAQSPSARQLLTWSGSAGIPLEWANITSTQQTILNSSDSLGTSRLNWLRGDRTQEQLATTPGPLRARTGVLGDIIDSSPTWVGLPSLAYTSPFSDAVYGGSGAPENATGAQTYSTYASNMATRTNVVYTGSNDGLLHGFRAGSYNTDGSYNSTNNDGLEVLGFMPSSVLANANVVGLTNPTYGHSYFVNATPGTGDLFYGGAWHTWLVGGLGSGGAEIYALDITDPSQFAETNAASLVKGDWTSSTLTCSNTTGCGANLGNTFGTPLIRRLHNGQWAIIFGNGFGSSTQHAGVFVGLVDSTTGAVTYRWLDTGTGSSSSPDGIAYVASADLDGDHVADYLYAGDLLGKVWRFDLTSSNPADWGVSKFGNAVPTPLFTAAIGSTPQPITTKIAVASTLTGGVQRVMVMFGTGQKIPATASAPDTFATGTQTFYGIWDWDMSKWNNGTTTASTVVIPASGTQYAELTAPQSFTRSNLLAQVLDSTTAGPGGTSQVLGYRSISAGNSVCWQGGAGCNQYGWDFDLPGTNEQIIYNPVIVGGAAVVNTTIPPSNTAGQCNQGTQTGWTMAFNIASGGGFPQNFFPSASGSLAAGSTGSIAGIQVNGVGSVSTVKVGNTTSIVTQTSSGQAFVGDVNPQNGTTGNRVTWEEIR